MQPGFMTSHCGGGKLYGTIETGLAPRASYRQQTDASTNSIAINLISLQYAPALCFFWRAGEMLAS